MVVPVCQFGFSCVAVAVAVPVPVPVPMPYDLYDVRIPLVCIPLIFQR